MLDYYFEISNAFERQILKPCYTQALSQRWQHRPRNFEIKMWALNQPGANGPLFVWDLNEHNGLFIFLLSIRGGLAVTAEDSDSSTYCTDSSRLVPGWGEYIPSALCRGAMTPRKDNTETQLCVYAQRCWSEPRNTLHFFCFLHWSLSLTWSWCDREFGVVVPAAETRVLLSSRALQYA